MQRTNGDSARWIAGLVLFFAGLYITSSVLFYFLCWRSDLSVLQGVGAEDPRFDGSVENPCGRSGAWLGELIAGRGFGLFGILLPVMLMLVGVRIIRRKPLMFNHSILSLFLIMILGSLTLGFVFGDKFNLIASSGWGGALGIEAARMLDEGIGAVGTALVLFGGWILTGVFINRNFINTVNSAGNAVVDKGGRIVEIVKHRVVPTHSRGDGAEGADATDGQTRQAPSGKGPGRSGRRSVRRRHRPATTTPTAGASGRPGPKVRRSVVRLRLGLRRRLRRRMPFRLLRLRRRLVSGRRGGRECPSRSRNLRWRRRSRGGRP